MDNGSLRRPRNSITRRVLQWNPQGRRRRTRPKNTRRRGVEQEMKEAHLTWGAMETTARDCVQCRQLVGGLCSTNPLKATIKTAQQRTIIQQYDCWHTGRWWVGCYIWYSEDGPGRAAAPPSPLLAVPTVTAHPSTASHQCTNFILFDVAL